MPRLTASLIVLSVGSVIAFGGCGAKTGFLLGSGTGTATGGAPSGGGGAQGTGGAAGASTAPFADKVDLLFVVDNSAYVFDEQEVLKRSVGTFLRELTNPPCVDDDGEIASQPASAEAECPSGSARRHPPVRDLHVGVVSSSLGGHGSPDTCEGFEKNDRGHLLASERGLDVADEGHGFLAWGQSSSGQGPTPLTDIDVLSRDTELMLSAGDRGCSYEAPLEAWYRFLADPTPPAEVVVEDQLAVKRGEDEDLLRQRAEFLRSDSVLGIVVLTDANDCSVVDGGYGYLMTSVELMHYGTSACAEDPNDACCSYCGFVESAPGCTPPAEDAACQRGKETEDVRGLRCWDMKRRFGIDLLYPVTRYVAALQDRELCPDSSAGDGDCQCRHAKALGVECEPGRPVPNPIYYDMQGTGARVRDPAHVFLLTITGVPWQDIATRETLGTPDTLRIKAGSDLDWDLILGSPDKGRLPDDILMVEDVKPRSGPPHPLTDVSPRPPDSPRISNPINGHEWNGAGVFKGHLQFSCIFDITSLYGFPRECTLNTTQQPCLCFNNDYRQYAQCQDPTENTYGNLQYADGAEPGLRQLEVVRQLDRAGLVGSSCPKVLSTDPQDPSYGYVPALFGLAERIGAVVR